MALRTYNESKAIYNDLCQQYGTDTVRAYIDLDTFHFEQLTRRDVVSEVNDDRPGFFPDWIVNLLETRDLNSHLYSGYGR